VLADLGHRAGQAAERGPRGQGQELRPAVGLDDERSRVAGRAVDQPAGARVEDAVADRGSFDVVHLRRERVEGTEHGER
jgi:hypothetical protein